MGKERFPELYRPMADEAAHLWQRTVPMEVLVLGFPRTGTSCKFLHHLARLANAKVNQRSRGPWSSLDMDHAITCVPL